MSFLSRVMCASHRAAFRSLRFLCETSNETVDTVENSLALRRRHSASRATETRVKPAVHPAAFRTDKPCSPKTQPEAASVSSTARATSVL
eukprot:3036217-Rhodomonas_salina.1